MMKTMLFLCMLGIAFCSQTQNQATMFEEQLGILSKHRIGKAILQMIKLKQFTEVDFSPLFAALDDLSGDIKDSKAEEQKSFEEAFNQYTSDSQFYGEQVTQYGTEVAQHQVDLQSLKLARVNLQQALMDGKSSVSQLNQDSNKLSQTMTKNEADTTQKSNEYDASISIIDQVISKMEQIKSSSFSQLSQDDLHMDTTTMHRRLGQLSDKAIFFEPLTQVLLEMCSNGFADQEAVMNVIKLLQQLRADLVASKATLQATSLSAKQENEDLLKQYENQLIQLQDEIIPGLQNDIDTKDGQIETKNNLLKDAQGNLQNAQDNLNEVNQTFESRKQQNKELNNGYDQELLAISQAVQALERGGIIRK